jgi:hypothetical protein
MIATTTISAPAPDQGPYVPLTTAAMRLGMSERAFRRFLSRLGVPLYYPSARKAVVRADELDQAVRSTRQTRTSTRKPRAVTTHEELPRSEPEAGVGSTTVFLLAHLGMIDPIDVAIFADNDCGTGMCGV